MIVLWTATLQSMRSSLLWEPNLQALIGGPGCHTFSFVKLSQPVVEETQGLAGHFRATRRTLDSVQHRQQVVEQYSKLLFT